MIGVVIPAHNEAAFLRACLLAVERAAAHPALEGEDVHIIVVLDACSDRTAEVAAAFGKVRTIEIDARNVGVARAVGAEAAIAQGARWLASTDADSRVHEDWLVQQLGLASDAVCGTVYVSDWSEHSEETRIRYDAHYVDRDGHRHVHGANLGVSREAYLAAGGFRDLIVGEDVALVASLMESGARIAWTAAPRVETSARRQFKARLGFGAFIADLGGAPA